MQVGHCTSRPPSRKEVFPPPGPASRRGDRLLCSFYFKYLIAVPEPAPTYDSPEAIVVAATIHLQAEHARAHTCTSVSALRAQSRPVVDTYCRATRGVPRSNGKRGATVVTPTRTSCRKVLYLEIWVGCTDAEGIEKSQYREKVFCGRSEVRKSGASECEVEWREEGQVLRAGATRRSGSRRPRWTGRRHARG